MYEFHWVLFGQYPLRVTADTLQQAIRKGVRLMSWTELPPASLAEKLQYHEPAIRRLVK